MYVTYRTTANEEEKNCVEGLVTAMAIQFGTRLVHNDLGTSSNPRRALPILRLEGYTVIGSRATAFHCTAYGGQAYLGRPQGSSTSTSNNMMSSIAH
jgi:hypothetical protein